MLMKTLRIATRESRLALIQAEMVAQALKTVHPHLEIELVKMTTEGDQVLDRPLAEIGGKGVFVKNLEHALLEGRADVAVHSLKDVPSELADIFELVAFLPRETPNDAFISTRYDSLASLPPKSKIGTSSPRRSAQVRRLRPDLDIHLLRGNVPTRLSKVELGELDAAILAVAGLKRLKLESHIKEALPLDDFLPACGQGILGLEILKNREELKTLLAPLDHAETRAAALAERSVCRALQGNCHSPISAFATLEKGQLRLRAQVLAPDGSVVLSAEVIGSILEAESLGDQAAQRLLTQGARAYL